MVLSTHQTGQMWREGKEKDGQHETFSSPSWVSYLLARPPNVLQGF
jgi:hypothetical protein